MFGAHNSTLEALRNATRPPPAQPNPNVRNSLDTTEGMRRYGEPSKN
jgi:hypothetical protein